MSKEFQQVEWDATVEDDCRQIVRLAVREDLDRLFDWTTLALVPAGAEGRAEVRTRQTGVVAGLRAAEVAVGEMDVKLRFDARVEDGSEVAAGDTLAALAGPARTLLSAERILLNLIGRLSGIATLTRKYVEAVRGTNARIYDTRKTTPGWRRLEKYAVRQGGGTNHRTGLFDAILIKDNHLALAAHDAGTGHLTAAEAARRARQFADNLAANEGKPALLVEVEVDTLAQLELVLGEHPDVVLLDNLTPAQLTEAVTLRNRRAPSVELEASGGVNLETVAAIARSGVERISIGALTHSAASLDVGLDWLF
ncbi:MAG TPA: carboxylating nicotinate-nucleotide diphosphorylase [Pirellulales bacterium]|nr:carboxylating nicotinate-nucleotide diphosphorylase [Pirellulales bacterium]